MLWDAGRARGGACTFRRPKSCGISNICEASRSNPGRSTVQQSELGDARAHMKIRYLVLGLLVLLSVVTYMDRVCISVARASHSRGIWNFAGTLGLRPGGFYPGLWGVRNSQRGLR